MDEPAIDGYCDERFAPVRELFARNIAVGGEVGAAVAVMLDSVLVVDLWGGFADRSRSRPWQRDTIVNVWSATKGLTALCAHRLAEQGRLNFDDPVCRLWPQFAGKDQITIAMLLNHRAGLPAISRPLADQTIYDWLAMTQILAEQEPWWEPGTRHGYHALTFGWLVGEVIRRACGRSVGAYLRQEVAGPFELDCAIGLESRDQARVADMIGADPPPPGQISPVALLLSDRASLSYRALANPPSLLRISTANTSQWRAAEIPAANAHTNARALARIYGMLARGGTSGARHLLGADAIARCGIEQSAGIDEVLRHDTRFSLGFMLPAAGALWGRGAGSFGHPGAGGSIGFADPQAGLGFGYTMNKMSSALAADRRADALIEAVYAAL